MIRKIRETDFISILKIERQCFGRNGWREQDFRETLDEGGTGWVATINGKVVGYQITITEAFRDYCELVNLAVLPEYRKLGIGRDLVRAAFEFCTHRPLLTYVRERNLQAQLLFRSCGLQAKRIIRGGHDNIDEDQYVMRTNDKPVPTLGLLPIPAKTAAVA